MCEQTTVKKAECLQCKGHNTEIEVDEIIDVEDGEESVIVSVWCLDCMTYSPLPIEADWREYR